MPSTVPSKSLNIVIIGAGIGGLCTALALRQQQHNVTIYEKSQFAQETGAAIMLGANVYGLLQGLGMEPMEWGAVSADKLIQYDHTGRVQFEVPVTVPGKPVSRFIHRVDLHDGLKQAAKKAGIPIKLKCGAKSVNMKTGVVELADGTTVSGDVILGADGIHSVVRGFVDPEGPQLRPNGTAMFRMLISAERIRQSAALKGRFVSLDGAALTVAEHSDLRLITYPCRNATLLNIGALFRERDLEQPLTAEQDLKASMLEMCARAGFDETVMELLNAAGDVTVWRLWDRPNLASWGRGRVALLGDAAHPIMPSSAQGGGQAIEDAVTLGELLPLGLESSQVPSRLKLYQDIRRERVELVQEYGRSQMLDPYGSMLDDPMDQAQFLRECFAHDAKIHAETVVRELV